MHFQIETTNHCNLSCVECPNRLMKRKREYMDMNTFDIILNNYLIPNKEKLETIIFHKDGEPLLHKYLPIMIAKVADSINAKLDIYTNGVYLTEDFVRFLGSIKNKVWLLISFHKFNADGKENDYTEVWKTIERCIRLNISNVEFIVVTHDTDLTTVEELEEWMTPWFALLRERNRLSAVHINQHINPWAGKIESKNLCTFTACPYADGEHFFIGVTGNVLPCCMALEEEVILGNVLVTDPEQIKLNRDNFYSNISKKERLTDLCKRCIRR